MINLLQRHYDCSEGHILVDDVPLDEIDAAWFRMQLGVVSQVRLLLTHRTESIRLSRIVSSSPFKREERKNPVQQRSYPAAGVGEGAPLFEERVCYMYNPPRLAHWVVALGTI
jgi:hypothetical protein